MVMRLKELREKASVPQKALADYLGCSTVVYSRYETGARMPSIDVLVKIADFYSVTMDYLVGRSETEEVIRPFDSVESAPSAQVTVPETDLSSPEKIKAYIDALVDEAVTKAIERMSQK